MTLTAIAKQVEKFTIDNSPGILTAAGVVGTATTAVLVGKASFKAAEIIAEEQRLHNLEEKSHDYTTKEKARFVWKLYIPAAGSGLLTVGAIIAANQIGTRRAAAMAAAYTISEKAFSEYREKVVEKLGENKEQAVRDEIAQDRVRANPPGDQEVLIITGQVLCYDGHSGRYFNSDMETLKGAQNNVNYKVLNNSYASLTDFYDEIGLSKTNESDEIGWNCDKMLELEFSTVLSETGRPCLAIGFRTAPVRDYYRLH